MSEHTEEMRLELRKDMFGATHAYDEGGDRICNERAFSRDEWAAIQRRIVACVNACQGIPTEVLEENQNDITSFIAEAGNHADEAQARADEAVRLLGDCEEYFDQRADADYPHPGLGPVPNEEMRLLTDIRAFIEAQK